MDYEKYLVENSDAMVAALTDVLQAESVRGEAVRTRDGQVYPFGTGVQEAFEKVLKLGEDMGFVTKNVDNYGGHIDFAGTGKPIVDDKGNVTGYEKPQVLGILGHLDVVPAAGGWSFEPFSGIVEDGYIYGRGTTDDKGPTISCLFAMKALKDAGFRPQATIRLILGLDEESGMTGMEYYFEHVERPDFGFTPDGDFPVINGEMGILFFDVARKFSKTQVKGLELRSLKGGTAPNSVPDHCRVVLRNQQDSGYEQIKEEVARFREETGYRIHVKGIGKSLEITTGGINAHGAHPWLGLNAISVMMAFLGRLNFVNDDHNDFIQFYNDHIGFCLDGEKMGICCEDEVSGKLAFNVGMADVDPEAGKLTVNIRYPISADAEDIYAGVTQILEKYSMGLVKDRTEEPIFSDIDSPMIRVMVDAYRKYTGDMESQPKVIGGGTYARTTDNVVAYGALFPGDPDLMHQKDERLSLERLDLMTKIYAEAIYKLASGEYNN